MKYCLYMDESGNHGLTQVDESFPVFLLCSVLIPESDYDIIRCSPIKTTRAASSLSRPLLYVR